MRNKLEARTVIWFDPAENGTFKHRMEIIDSIGEGGTGIIYTGRDDNGIVWVVKESFPNTESSIFSSVHVYRKEDGNIVIHSEKEDYDLNIELNRILENENEVALSLQNDLTNGIMNMPFYNGILKGAAIQCPGQTVPTVCSQMFTRMQYIKGTTADKAVFKDTLERLKGIEDILKTVARIHQAGFILGDIKPQNIMIADGGRCFVLDYGSAVRTDDNGIAQIDPLTYPRSSGYIGPELADSDNNCLTKAYDVYSLGALLMDLLLPERTRTIRELQYHKRAGLHDTFLFENLQNYGAFSKLSIQKELPLSPALADQLSRILQKCLADDREERYPSAGELLKDYSVFLKNYQYKTLQPQEYDYHLFWQASYDYLAERLNDMISGRISKVNAMKAFRKPKPDWWKLRPLRGYDSENNCYPDIRSITEALNKECVYLHAIKGSGKTIKTCQIMQKKLWEMPVLYVDSGLWSNAEYPADRLTEDVLLKDALRESFGYLPGNFIEGLKTAQEHFLIVMDNINNVDPNKRKAIFKVIARLRSAFNNAEILLIGLNETIGDDDLDVSFKKIRLEGLKEQDNPLLRIPFFFMRYQEMKHKDPEFVLDTSNEVEFLKLYMDSLGKDYYKCEKLLMNIAADMGNGYLYYRHILVSSISYLLEKEFGQSEQPEILDLLTEKLGLLVPTQFNGFDAYEFVNDKYQDYFTARWLLSLIEDSIRYESLKPLAALLIYKLDNDVMKLLLELLSQQQQDKLFGLLNEAEIGNTGCEGIVISFVNYYWTRENHTVNRWAESGVRHQEDFSMAVTATDLIMKITPENPDPLEKAVQLCLQGMKLRYRYPNDWPRAYLGMMVLHDALEVRNCDWYLDTENFQFILSYGTAVTVNYKYYEDVILGSGSSVYRNLKDQKYYPVKGSIGKIGDLNVSDGLKLFFGDDPPAQFLSLLSDLTDQSAEEETADDVYRKICGDDMPRSYVNNLDVLDDLFSL